MLPCQIDSTSWETGCTSPFQQHSCSRANIPLLHAHSPATLYSKQLAEPKAVDAHCNSVDAARAESWNTNTFEEGRAQIKAGPCLPPVSASRIIISCRRARVILYTGCSSAGHLLEGCYDRFGWPCFSLPPCTHVKQGSVPRGEGLWASCCLGSRVLLVGRHWSREALRWEWLNPARLPQFELHSHSAPVHVSEGTPAEWEGIISASPNQFLRCRLSPCQGFLSATELSWKESNSSKLCAAWEREGRCRFILGMWKAKPRISWMNLGLLQQII